MNPQALAVHEACACATFVVQAVVHAPQWLALLVRSTQLPLHWLGAVDGQPDAHA